MDNIRWRIVGVMFLPSIFENRCGDFRRSMWRLSKIDVATFEDRCIAFRRSTMDVTMCRPSKIDDRWSMCRTSKIDGRCEIRLLYLLKTLILYISCMRITPRVCTSVLSLVFVIRISVPFHGSVPTNRTLSSTIDKRYSLSMLPRARCLCS